MGIRDDKAWQLMLERMRSMEQAQHESAEALREVAETQRLAVNWLNRIDTALAERSESLSSRIDVVSHEAEGLEARIRELEGSAPAAKVAIRVVIVAASALVTSLIGLWLSGGEDQ